MVEKNSELSIVHQLFCISWIWMRCCVYNEATLRRFFKRIVDVDGGTLHGKSRWSLKNSMARSKQTEVHSGERRVDGSAIAHGMYLSSPRRTDCQRKPLDRSLKRKITRTRFTPISYFFSIASTPFADLSRDRRHASWLNIRNKIFSYYWIFQWKRFLKQSQNKMFSVS